MKMDRLLPKIRLAFFNLIFTAHESIDRLGLKKLLHGNGDRDD